MKLKVFETALSISFAVLLISCSANRNAPSNSPVSVTDTGRTRADDNMPLSNHTNGGCDPELWKRVYNPSRLEVLEQCKVATGVIDELDQNEDGDTHMLLKLDPGQEGLLVKRNIKKKNGDLVIEVVCANAITDKKAVEACKGYSSTVTLPSVGDHVTVTGTYVNDSHNGWTEIHPVTSIQKH
jgi:hypothetical protein